MVVYFCRSAAKHSAVSVKLVSGYPFISAAAAFKTPSLVRGNTGIKDVNILYAYRIAGSQHCRYIMRIKNILEQNGKVGLTAVQNV